MYKNFKLSFFVFIIILISCALYIISALYIHDPLQIWHKPFFRGEAYSYSIRESAKSFIRDYDFDSVILGNSLTENLSANEVGKLLGGKFFNLSFQSLSLIERNIIFKYLKKHKNIKQVIFVTDLDYLTLQIKNPYYDIENYIFLYNDNIFDDIKIYLNNRFFYCSLFFSNDCVGSERNIDSPYRWLSDEWQYKRLGGFHKWVENYDNRQIRDYFEILKNTPISINTEKISKDYVKSLPQYLEEYFFSIIESNSDVKFYVFIPPLSDIEYARMLRDNNLSFKKYLLMVQYFSKRSSEISNMELYYFDNIREMTDIKHFKDDRHFDDYVANYVITSMSKKQHILTPENVDKYLDIVKEKVYSFEYVNHYNQLKNKYKIED